MAINMREEKKEASPSEYLDYPSSSKGNVDWMLLIRPKSKSASPSTPTTMTAGISKSPTTTRSGNPRAVYKSLTTSSTKTTATTPTPPASHSTCKTINCRTTRSTRTRSSYLPRGTSKRQALLSQQRKSAIKDSVLGVLGKIGEDQSMEFLALDPNSYQKTTLRSTTNTSSRVPPNKKVSSLESQQSERRHSKSEDKLRAIAMRIHSEQEAITAKKTKSKKERKDKKDKGKTTKDSKSKHKTNATMHHDKKKSSNKSKSTRSSSKVLDKAEQTSSKKSKKERGTATKITTTTTTTTRTRSSSTPSSSSLSNKRPQTPSKPNNHNPSSTKVLTDPACNSSTSSCGSIDLLPQSTKPQNKKKLPSFLKQLQVIVDLETLMRSNKSKSTEGRNWNIHERWFQMRWELLRAIDLNDMPSFCRSHAISESTFIGIKTKILKSKKTGEVVCWNSIYMKFCPNLKEHFILQEAKIAKFTLPMQPASNNDIVKSNMSGTPASEDNMVFDISLLKGNDTQEQKNSSVEDLGFLSKWSFLNKLLFDKNERETFRQKYDLDSKDMDKLIEHIRECKQSGKPIQMDLVEELILTEYEYIEEYSLEEEIIIEEEIIDDDEEEEEEEEDCDSIDCDSLSEGAMQFWGHDSASGQSCFSIYPDIDDCASEITFMFDDGAVKMGVRRESSLDDSWVSWVSEAIIE